MAGILSPSLANLFIGKAFVLFQRTGFDSGNVHLGKLTDIEYTPAVEVAQYYDESQGIRIMADAAIKQVGGSGKITLNELTVYNLGLLMLGNPDYTTPASPQLQIFGFQTPLTGPLTIVSTNGKGPRYQWNITKAMITPAGAFKHISQDYGTLDINFQHLADQNSQFGTIVELPDVNSIAPTNWTLPFITGTRSSNSPAVPVGGTPAAVTHGDTLTVNVGQWTTGSSGVSYTYQWKQDGSTPIGGATNQTYTTVLGDQTHTITCSVTATNSIGATTVASGATQTVA